MGGPFFRRNGLLFLSEDTLKETLAQLSKSSSFLETLAADPSLRGVMSAMSLPLRGVQLRRVSLNSLAPQFNALSAPIENTLAGRPAYFSWRELLSGEPPARRETSQFVEIDPVLDFNSLEPGEDATNAIREAAAELKLNEEGVTVRVTGSIPIRTTSSPPCWKGRHSMARSPCLRSSSFFGSRCTRFASSLPFS